MNGWNFLELTQTLLLCVILSFLIVEMGPKR